MGRSGRGSQTSAVCESDRADNVDVWTELGGGGREAGGGECSDTRPLTSVHMI